MQSAHAVPSSGKRASVKLTAGVVRGLALPRGKLEDKVFDSEVAGFAVRLRDGGSKKFIFDYKLGAKQRRMTIGDVSALTVDAARKTAAKLYARVKLGQDPASDKAEAKTLAAETFGTTIGAYLAYQRSRLRPRNYPNEERNLLKHAKALHALPLRKITRREIAAVLTAIGKHHSVAANRVRSSLSGFFSWAMTQGLVDANPVIGTAKNEERSRDRVLLPAELRAIWAALTESRYSDIIRLLALTGARAREIAELRWSEIHDDTIILPGDRTKNGKAHVIPLAKGARDSIARQSRHSDFVFGHNKDSGPFAGWSKAKLELDARIAAAGKVLPHWTTHDLRRTFATYAGGGLPEHLLKKLPPVDKKLASGLGIPPHVIEAALNHVSGFKAGVAGIYNGSSYSAEVKTALDRWAEHLMAIVEGRDSNVMPLRREA